METRREQVLWCAWRPARSNTPNSCWLAMPLALVSGARATAPAAYARYMHSPRGSSTREPRLRTRNVTFAMLMRVSPSQAFTATAECRHRPHGAWQHWLMRSPLPYIQAILCKLLGGHALAWLSTALALCVQLSCVCVCCTCSHGETICVGPTTSSSSIDGGAAFFWASSSGMRPARADEAAGDARAARANTYRTLVLVVAAQIESSSGYRYVRYPVIAFPYCRWCPHGRFLIYSDNFHDSEFFGR